MLPLGVTIEPYAGFSGSKTANGSQNDSAGVSVYKINGDAVD